MTSDREEDVISVRVGARIARQNITYWLMELEHRHDEIKDEIEHEDDYQNGYLHGMNSVIAYLKERMVDIDVHDKEMIKFLKELREEQEGDYNG